MADEQPEVVIRDAEGTEHVFPPGFDPQKAAGIVRQQTFKGETFPHGPQPPGGITDSPDDSPAGWVSSTRPLERLNSALTPLAHPTTAGDFLGLALPTNEMGQVVSKGARVAIDAAKEAPNLRTMPSRVLKGLYQWATESPADTASHSFNALPLSKQMEALPQSAPASASTRSAGPPPQIETPFNELPLWKQMEALPPTKAPATTRSAGPPVQSPTPTPGDDVAAAFQQRFGQPMGEGSRSILERGRPTPPPMASAPAAAEAPLRTDGPVSTDTAFLGQPRPIHIKPEKLSPEQWQELRRYYGSDDLAKLTGVPATEIKATLAPGPSRMPLNRETAIMDEFIRQLGMER